MSVKDYVESLINSVPDIPWRSVVIMDLFSDEEGQIGNAIKGSKFADDGLSVVSVTDYEDFRKGEFWSDKPEVDWFVSLPPPDLLDDALTVMWERCNEGMAVLLDLDNADNQIGWMTRNRPKHVILSKDLVWLIWDKYGEHFKCRILFKGD